MDAEQLLAAAARLQDPQRLLEESERAPGEFFAHADGEMRVVDALIAALNDPGASAAARGAGVAVLANLARPQRRRAQLLDAVQALSASFAAAAPATPALLLLLLRVAPAGNRLTAADVLELTGGDECEALLLVAAVLDEDAAAAAAGCRLLRELTLPQAHFSVGPSSPGRGQGQSVSAFCARVDRMAAAAAADGGALLDSVARAVARGGLQPACVADVHAFVQNLFLHSATADAGALRRCLAGGQLLPRVVVPFCAGGGEGGGAAMSATLRTLVLLTFGSGSDGAAAADADTDEALAAALPGAEPEDLALALMACANRGPPLPAEALAAARRLRPGERALVRRRLEGPGALPVSRDGAAFQQLREALGGAPPAEAKSGGPPRTSADRVRQRAARKRAVREARRAGRRAVDDAAVVPASFRCAINGHVMREPVRATASGAVFERAAIEGAVECPLSGGPLGDLVPDRALAVEIARWRASLAVSSASSSSSSSSSDWGSSSDSDGLSSLSSLSSLSLSEEKVGGRGGRGGWRGSGSDSDDDR